ncbi:MAG TPA: LysR substrate-binding domain-containing protein [Streptosporangiaceae bacterium]|jgi:DNA-binding transcriptional LysR family regulator
MFDVRRLRLLHQLAAHGTVTATAQALHLTGPAVSQQLAALEREAGSPLLEKHGRTLRLTAAGRLLVDHAEVILGDVAAAEAALTELRTGTSGTVRVAAFPSAARVLLPPVWERLAARPEPRVTLRLADHEPDAATRALTRAEADIAVVHAYTLLPRDLPPGCERRVLLEEPVLLAVRPDLAARYGLAAGDPADLRAFADEPWLAPGPDTSCRELTQRACGAAGFVPHPVAVSSDFAVLTRLAAAGAGVALVPRMSLPDGPHGASLHPLAEPVTRTVSALTRTGTARQPHVRAVLDLLAEAGRERLWADRVAAV